MSEQPSHSQEASQASIHSESVLRQKRIAEVLTQTPEIIADRLVTLEDKVAELSHIQQELLTLLRGIVDNQRLVAAETSSIHQPQLRQEATFSLDTNTKKTDEETLIVPTSDTLSEAKRLMENGDQIMAQIKVEDSLNQDPNNIEALLLYTQLAPTPEDQAAAARKILELQPDNTQAQAVLDLYNKTWDKTEGVMPFDDSTSEDSSDSSQPLNKLKSQPSAETTPQLNKNFVPFVQSITRNTTESETVKVADNPQQQHELTQQNRENAKQKSSLSYKIGHALGSLRNPSVTNSEDPMAQIYRSANTSRSNENK